MDYIYEIAALFKDASIVTLVSAISPYMEMRRRARERIGNREFVEVYVTADLQTLIKRDPKGLYRKALAGEITDFTGISAPYEEPVNPEITLDTDKVTIEEGASIVLNYIWKRILI
ncbi:MAG TPA: adenylyl-sulfate kinase [Pseudobacteroides sp.]|uniref:adenylyl-sulfate kinase n=1 Tax=Pseudobacteroides sp. TaxID=1968840 RepID=UPI002F92DD4E